MFSGAPLLLPLDFDSPKKAPLGGYCAPGDCREAL